MDLPAMQSRLVLIRIRLQNKAGSSAHALQEIQEKAASSSDEQTCVQKMGQHDDPRRSKPSQSFSMIKLRQVCKGLISSGKYTMASGEYTMTSGERVFMNCLG